MNIRNSISHENGDMITTDHGATTRFNSSKKVIYLVFTGHEFADGGNTIVATLRKQHIPASFFFTGDFYRNPSFAGIIQKLIGDGHYLGSHSDKHLLYADWDNRDSTLVTKSPFMEDLHAGYQELSKFGISPRDARYFLPPYEWYNDTIAAWTKEMGLQLINFTPGTSSNADYTTPEMKNYQSSDSIYTRILRYESTAPQGLNGFILLLHFGTDPARTDKFYYKLDELITELKKRGYSFQKL